MKIYQLGPDSLSELEDDEQFEWVVHWYESGDYEGSGEAVGLCKQDGLLYVKNLSHCSCYGPLDDGMDRYGDGLKYGDSITIDEFFRKKDSVHDFDVLPEIKTKVIELLQWKAPVFCEKFNFIE